MTRIAARQVPKPKPPFSSFPVPHACASARGWGAVCLQRLTDTTFVSPGCLSRSPFKGQKSSFEPAASSRRDEGESGKKKTLAGVSRRKSIAYEREEFEKKSAEEQRRERNRKKMEESEFIDDVSQPRRRLYATPSSDMHIAAPATGR